jgi:hypothetical protein
MRSFNPEPSILILWSTTIRAVVSHDDLLPFLVLFVDITLMCE